MTSACRASAVWPSQRQRQSQTLGLRAWRAAPRPAPRHPHRRGPRPGRPVPRLSLLDVGIAGATLPSRLRLQRQLKLARGRVVLRTTNPKSHGFAAARSLRSRPARKPQKFDRFPFFFSCLRLEKTWGPRRSNFFCRAFRVGRPQQAAIRRAGLKPPNDRQTEAHKPAKNVPVCLLGAASPSLRALPLVVWSVSRRRLPPARPLGGVGGSAGSGLPPASRPLFAHLRATPLAVLRVTSPTRSRPANSPPARKWPSSPRRHRSLLRAVRRRCSSPSLETFMIVSDRAAAIGKTARRVSLAAIKYAAGGVALFLFSYLIGLWLISTL